MNEPLITVIGLTKDFSLGRGKILRAVDNISFSIEAGGILGIIGESGCGKSTMGRSIIRLIEPTAGKVTLAGRNITGLTRKELKTARQNMQMIFQDPFGALNPRRTVYEIIAQSIRTHSLANSKEEEAAMAKAVLEDVGLAPAEDFMFKYPASMSGGQLQRVSMARVLVLNPEFIIADEPVSMLDVSVRIGILKLLRQIRDTHSITFVYITHDLSTARYICDRIAIMYLGGILEIGPIEAVLSHPLHPYTKALVSAVPCIKPELKEIDIPIKGWVPVDYENLDSRCRFADRCPEAMEVCFTTKPLEKEEENNHSVSCHLY